MKLLIENIKLKSENKKLKKEIYNVKKDFDYIFEENKILKQINKKRYVEQSKRMQFLIKRENKLQEIEQLVKSPRRNTRKILKIIMRSDNNEER